jgi:Cu-Zn family superoxide dismutase
MVTACGSNPPEAEDADVAAGTVAPAPDPIAHVSLAPTQGNKVAGMLMFTERTDGVAVSGSVSGLPADAEVGFHVHERGDCSAPDASSAGEHFNPLGHPHGDPSGNSHHVGDMPNLEANDDGVAEFDFTIDDAALSGPAERNLTNRAVVVHVMKDDYETQPSGNSGARVACGVIPPLASIPAD